MSPFRPWVACVGVLCCDGQKPEMSEGVGVGVAALSRRLRVLVYASESFLNPLEDFLKPPTRNANLICSRSGRLGASDRKRIVFLTVELQSMGRRTQGQVGAKETIQGCE